MTKFEVGKRYFEKASYPTTQTYTIVRRTAKSVWDQYGRRHAVKVVEGPNGDVEFFDLGSYSLHPICTSACEWSAEEEERIVRRDSEYTRMV